MKVTEADHVKKEACIRAREEESFDLDFEFTKQEENNHALTGNSIRCSPYCVQTMQNCPA